MSGYEDGFPRCETDKIALDTTIPGTGFRLAPITGDRRIDVGTATRVDREFYCLSAKKLAIWQELSLIRERCSWPERVPGEYRDANTGNLMISRSQNLTMNDEIASTLVAGISFMLYGCIHLLAWFYAFSTAVEQRLWQLAVAAVISFTPFVAAVAAFFVWTFNMMEEWDKVCLVRGSFSLYLY
jgi:hypothetical protein